MLSRVAVPALVTVLLGMAALVVATAPSVFAAGGGETLQVAVPGQVSCADSSGNALGADPTLAPGQQIVCTLAGFAPNEMVDVTLDPGGRDLGTISMNAQGGATYDFTVPSDATPGPATLSFTGETSKGVGTFGFTVSTATATPTTTSAAGSGGGGGSGAGSGGLSFTGVYVFGPVVAGLVLIGAGSALTLAHRRRRHG